MVNRIRTDIPNSLQEHWMPFSSNKDFKKNPRLISNAKGIYLKTHDGNTLIDGSSGLYCNPLGHGRREIIEAYIQRIKELENTALSFDGVTKAYAIQAGRELRVFVESEKVGDKRADELAFEISEKIESEMTYPGQVKITVIREKRAVSYAK